jgi:hypothetical protein
MSDEPKKRRGKAVKDKRGEPATFVPGNGAGPKQFDAQAVAEEIKLYWENEGGDNFWINNAAGWSKWPLKALENLMTRHMVRAKKREGEFLSDSQQLLLYVREHRCVDEVMSAISGYPAGRYELSSGHRVIVRYPPKLIEPKEGDWGVVKELIESKLNLSLNMVPGPDQTAYFHGWMKTALEGLLTGGPGNFRPGQCCIFAGPRDSGKSRIQHQIITGLLGGRSADPGPYLFGRTDFNGEMFSAEHLMMEDPASSTKTVDRVYFGEMLKQLVVNDTQRLHRKREDAMVVSPFFRTSISINDDPDKMRVLPLLTPDMKDKVNLFLVSSRPLPMPTTTLDERAEFRRVIAAQLPAYAWWLLKEHEIDEARRSIRFGVREWHHPALAMELFDDTPAAELLQIIDAAEFTLVDEAMPLKLWQMESRSSMPGEFWEDTALVLERLMIGEDPRATCSLAREAKKVFMHNKADRLLARLGEDQPGRVSPHRTKQARQWIIAKPE